MVLFCDEVMREICGHMIEKLDQKFGGYYYEHKMNQGTILSAMDVSPVSCSNIGYEPS